MVASITKTPVDRRAAAAIVGDAFDGVRLAGMEELTLGGFSSAYALDLTDGRRVVMKVAPPPDVTLLRYERDLLGTEVAALRLADGLGVPVPTVLWHDTSRRHVGSDLMLMTWCTGTLARDLWPSLTPEQQADVDAQVGRLLAVLHAHTRSSFGLFSATATSFERWSDAFVDLYDMVIDDAQDADVPLPRPYENLRLLPRRHVAELDEVSTASFVHWDLWHQNVFVNPDTAQVTGLIDFERAMWADPLIEINFAIKGEDPAFVQAYGHPVLIDEAARLRRRLYDLYLSTVMTVESTYRRYEEPENESMGRMWLDATLAHFVD